MTGLENKIALITGGNRGLGKDMALRFSKFGANVIFTYRSNKEEAEQVVAQIESNGQKAAALQLDVSETTSFDAFVNQLTKVLKEKFGTDKFDFLVNNAGYGAHAMIAETSEEVLDNMINVHFKGVYLLTQKALPLINDDGRIINLSSGLARFSFPGYAAYAAMKGAIEVFTRYLAKELGQRGITANTVAPGAIDNDFNKYAFDAHPEIKNMLASQTALGRVGVSEDIGGVITFLCSEEGRWVNGQRLEVSGGMIL